MKKLLNIALKDLTVVFRDRSALIAMLATPFLLTLAMAFAFGRLTGGSSSAGLSHIPVIIVNYDTGQFSQAIAQAFESRDLADLVDVMQATDEATARSRVDEDTAAAAIIIPSDFSESILPAGVTSGDFSTLLNRKQAVVEVYGSPARPISVSIVRSIVDEVLNRLAAGLVGGQVSIAQLIASGLISPQQIQALAQSIGEQAGQAAATIQLIDVKSEMSGAQSGSAGFDWLAYMAPSMAIMFLMFTVTAGGRSILSERQWGTLPRLLTTPSSPVQVLGGKIVGIFLTGSAQVFILIVFSGLAFGVWWGSPIAVVALTLAVVAAATSWGSLLAAYARSPGQANSIGTMLALIFAGIAGNFVPRQNYPQWLQNASLFTPNAWGLEGFIKLAGGGSLADILGPIIALLLMAVVLFGISVIAFRRQYK